MSEENNNRHTSVLKYFSATDSLFVTRILSLLVVTLYPFIGLAFQAFEPGLYDPVWMRIAISIGIGIAISFSYTSEYVRQRVSAISLIFYYILTIHLLYLCYANENYSPYVIGLFIVLSGASIIVHNKTSLVVYSILVMAGTVFCALIAQNSHIPPYTLITLGFIAVIVTSSLFGVRAKLLSNLSFTDKIFNKINAVVIVINKKGELIYVSPTVQEVLGYEPSELIGTGWKKKLGQAPNPSDLITTDNKDLFYTEVEKKDGETRYLRWSSSGLSDRYTIGLAQDFTEEKLKQNELDELSVIAKKIDNYVIVTDHEDRIAWVNESFTKITGFSLDEVRGKRPEKVLTNPKTSRETIEKIYEGQKTHKPVQAEILNSKKDGSDLWLSVHVTPVSNEEGKIFKFITIGADITERKKREEREAREEAEKKFINGISKELLSAKSNKEITRVVFSAFLDSLKIDYISLFFYNEKKETFSRQAFQHKEAGISHSFSSFEAVDNDFLTVMKEGEECFTDSCKGLQGKDGNGFSTDSKIAYHLFLPMNYRNEMHAVAHLGFIRKESISEVNIRMLKKASKDIAIKIHEFKLQRALRVSNQELTNSNAQLEQVNSELRSFSHIVSHDLKAPLRAIGSLAHWISDDYSDKFDEDGKEQMNILIDRVKRMDGLIDGILKYSKIGQTEVPERTLDLNMLVNSVIDMLAPPQHIEVNISTKLPELLVDEVKIQQVFLNILSNAIKFMDKEKGYIEIGHEESNEVWKFHIKDNGPGIPEKHFNRIFKIFQTLKPRDEIESTGIGLSIVKKIVTSFKGEVWLESNGESGSIFYFTIAK